MISFKDKGDFKKTFDFLKSATKSEYTRVLDQCGEMGVNALAAATPKKSGTTAASWSYEIHRSGKKCSIIWTNNNINKGVNVAIILQYGHGTGRGGYVKGIDYINPALRPVFDKISDIVWKEVTKS